MSTRTTTILVLLMIVVAILAGLLLWNRLPEQMASHWNINDQVDGYVSRFWGVFMLPLISLGMFLLFLVIPNVDPLKANIAQFREAFNLFITLITGFMLYIYALTLLWSLGYTGFGMSRAHAACHGTAIHFHRFHAPQGKTQFLHRDPYTMDALQR